MSQYVYICIYVYIIPCICIFISECRNGLGACLEGVCRSSELKKWRFKKINLIKYKKYKNKSRERITGKNRDEKNHFTYIITYTQDTRQVGRLVSKISPGGTNFSKGTLQMQNAKWHDILMKLLWKMINYDIKVYYNYEFIEVFVRRPVIETCLVNFMH